MICSADNLTCGRRVVRCLLGEPIDHVPFGVGIGWSPWDKTIKQWRRESGNPELDPSAFFGFEGSFAVPQIHSGIFPGFESKVLEENEKFIIWTDEKGVTRRDRRDYESMPEFLDYPVKTPSDWERLKKERLRIDQPGRITQDWEKFRDYLKATGAAVQVGDYPWGVFGTVRDLLGAEEMLVCFYTEPEMIHDMMDHLTTLWISLWERLAAEVRIDHIHIWEDMSGKQGSLISPAMVEEFMMPCYDRIADFARSAGVPIISVDTDGDCSELVPIMMRHGVNMFFPFEVQAGNDLLKYRQLYPELGIMGGLDKRVLAGTREEVESEIMKAERMIEQGRYIPGFDHLIPPDAKWENFRYAAEAIKEICFA